MPSWKGFPKWGTICSGKIDLILPTSQIGIQMVARMEPNKAHGGNMTTCLVKREGEKNYIVTVLTL